VIEVLRWPHGGHGDCASARAGYGVRRWARPAGADVGGRFTALQRRQRCCRFRSLYWGHGRCSERPDDCANAENASLEQECGLPCTGGGQMHPGDHAPPQGGHRAPFWAFCYEITDLRIYPPPSPSHAPTRSRAPPNQVTAGGPGAPPARARRPKSEVRRGERPRLFSREES